MTWPVQRGHGLWLVQAVAEQVSVACGPDGSQVTAVFTLPVLPGFRAAAGVRPRGRRGAARSPRQAPL